MEILPADKKFLIINADDFGQAESINRGIIEAHETGMVTSASILANGEAAQSAVEKSRDYPKLGLGIHLSLVYGVPCAPRERVESLLFKEGNFARGYGQFALRYYSGGVKLCEVEYEWECQREKLGDIRLYHLDSHQHLHLLPGLFKTAVKLAKKWDIKIIRVPWENIRVKTKGGTYMPMKVLNFYSRGKKNILAENGINHTDYFFGSSFSGGMVKSAWEEVIPVIPIGLTEIMCHPGRENENTRKRYGWKNKWEEELKALTDEDLKNAAQSAGIVFTNFQEVSGGYFAR